MRNAFCFAQSLFVLAMFACPSSAGDFPTKTIRIVVPYAPGSTADVRTRQIAKPLADRLGVPVIVENKPGASATIGNAAVAQAKPDGHTLLYVNNGGLCIAAHLVPNLPYDAQQAFAPVTLVAYAATVLVVPGGFPSVSPKEFVAAAKAKPGKLTYGSSGIGSVQHIPAAWFAKQTGIDLLHIPYKSDAETLLELTNGRIDMSIAAFTGAMPHIKSGKLKALAVTSGKRVPLLPDTPTMAEAGYPDFEWQNWFGYVAPAGTPAAVIERLRNEITAVFDDAALRADYMNTGYDLVNATPAEFSTLIEREHQRYGELLRTIGLVPQ